MRIAVVGAGVSGNVCAYLLQRDHEVTIYESGAAPGGHTHTIEVPAYGNRYVIDTGFMVFNDRTYPNFVRLLEHLGVPSQPSDMSFSVRCDRSGWEYQGSSLNGLFAQRRNAFNPSFYRMLLDIVRFNRDATEMRDRLSDDITLGEYLAERRCGARLVSHYLVPMTAAIWSAVPARILEMPARFLFQFFHNHGLLQIRDRPQWKTIPGGARQYVEGLLRPLAGRIRLAQPVKSIQRSADCVQVENSAGDVAAYDAVVLACHADTALRILAEPTPDEQRVLSQFGYQTNVAVVHTDPSYLPRRRRAWASWNYHVDRDTERPVTVTYELNRLQRLGAPGPICVTLNAAKLPDTHHRLQEIEFRHPVFGPGTLNAQAAHDTLNGQQRTYFCGAYWGYGFHEDGVRSALAVAKCFGRSLADLKPAGRDDGSPCGDGPRSAASCESTHA